jgi:ABC-2 type transport system permease protein
MSQSILLGKLEFKETLRAKWYQLYLLSVSLMISLLFYFGLAESRVLGFTGLGRLLLTLIQVSIIVLPIFTMMSTARTLVGDRETGVWEYNLSIPVKLSSFYWGRSFGRYLALYLPLVAGLYAGGILSLIKGYSVAWPVLGFYTVFIGANIFCFSGLALLISVYSRSQEMALGLAFVLWLVFEGLMDALLLGLMVKQRVLAEIILGLAFLNPLQAFRMAAIALFDPDLTILGPIAYTIIEKVGFNKLLIWATLWPSLLGFIFAYIGYRGFRKKDLI